MGKKNKKQLADKVRASKVKEKERKPNPFELKINRQKHVVLGRNQNIRGQVGKPGQSRSKAMKRRAKTLLVELKESGKSNSFKDQRLGEKNPSLSADDKAIQRFALERKTQSQRKGRLEEEGEEEQLTHYGQSLADIEKFEDPQDSDPDEDGNISGKMVAQEHFGGFLTRRTEEPGSEKKSWKEKMADLISQSKKEKYERQTEKDDIAKKTQELDEEWKSVHQLLFAKKKSDQPDSKDLRKADDYDISVRKLQFEIKGKPSNRLKSEEEIAKEEAERLKKLEADRKRRMMGESEPSEKGPTHISADSLEDSFDPTDSRKKKFHVMFKDGHLLEKPQKQGKKKQQEQTIKQTVCLFLLLCCLASPADYESLVSLLSGRSMEEQLTVVERLVACHHPSIAEGNKQKLELLFSLLLQYVMEAVVQEKPLVELLDGLTPMLHRLLRYNPDAGSNAVLQFLLDRYDEFQQICQRRGGRGKYMGLDTLLLLKLVHVFFPTSDFRHPVVTPAFYFMADMLGQTPVQNERDVAAGLYLCTVCLEYISLSSRYVPEVINFLHGVLFLAADKDPSKLEKVFPPFKPVGNHIDLLKLKGSIDQVPVLNVTKTLATGVEKQDLDTDEFRISSISTCVHLLQEFSHLYSKLPATPQVFAPVLNMLKKLPTSLYPQGVKESVDMLVATLEKDATRPLTPLTVEKKRPQPLKMFEPRVEEVFDGKKKRKGSRELLEKQRLQHKVKREFKGALREIRKDSCFLAKQQLQDTLEKDNERKRKLSRLYADLSTQEGEFKALKRMKDKS
ncbi:hypothetical protein BaRGS_00015560 [Batillaria attramentaria]|uniref:Nucleolar protein 14 n=1 Tax=Batillaria attramentaria TaxID=370345 RepID=A0ABD0L124_9CAEN